MQFLLASFRIRPRWLDQYSSLWAIHLPEISFPMWPSLYWLRLKPILDHHRRLNLHMIFGENISWKQQVASLQIRLLSSCILRFDPAKLGPWLSAGYCETNSRPGFLWRKTGRKIWGPKAQYAWIVRVCEGLSFGNYIMKIILLHVAFGTSLCKKWTLISYLITCYITILKFHASLLTQLTRTPLFVSWDQALDTASKK